VAIAPHNAIAIPPHVPSCFVILIPFTDLLSCLFFFHSLLAVVLATVSTVTYVSTHTGIGTGTGTIALPCAMT
ncbi:hypothetical protein PDK45_28335, partial [Bacillus cereus]|nr:hypothetical protein [Bacillus cereus]